MDSETTAIIIGAAISGAMAIIGMLTMSIVVIVQAQNHKKDTDSKLEVIRIDVNSNLTAVKQQLESAMRILNEDRASRGLEAIVPEQLEKEK